MFIYKRDQHIFCHYHYKKWCLITIGAIISTKQYFHMINVNNPKPTVITKDTIWHHPLHITCHHVGQMSLTWRYLMVYKKDKFNSSPSKQWMNFHCNAISTFHGPPQISHCIISINTSNIFTNLLHWFHPIISASTCQICCLIYMAWSRGNRWKSIFIIDAFYLYKTFCYQFHLIFVHWAICFLLSFVNPLVNNHLC